jgi:hypothetical protein
MPKPLFCCKTFSQRSATKSENFLPPLFLLLTQVFTRITLE